LLEEVAQQSGSLGFTDAADDLGTMVARSGLEDAGSVVHTPTLGS